MAAHSPDDRQRFYCHTCDLRFAEAGADYKCPFCTGGFIEQLEDSPIGSPENAEGRDEPHPVTVGQISDIGIDDMDELPQNDSTSPLENDLAVLMSGDRIRSITGRVPLGAAESILQQIMWQVSGGRAGGPPLFLVERESRDIVMTNDNLDAIMSQLLWNPEHEGPPPLAQEIIENLPEVSITEEQVSLQCSVCWETYNLDEKVRQLKCGHLYHQGCIFPWLSLHATCPICRQSLAPPETADSDQRTGSIGSRDSNSVRGVQSLILRSYRLPLSNQPPGEGPVATGSAPANPAPSNSVPFSPAPGDAAPNSSETSETTSGENDPSSTDTTNASNTPSSDTNTRHLNPPPIAGGRIVLMSSVPSGTSDNNVAEYIALWTGSAPVTSTPISSPTPDVNSGRFGNLDMELD